MQLKACGGNNFSQAIDDMFWAICEFKVQLKADIEGNVAVLSRLISLHP